MPEPRATSQTLPAEMAILAELYGAEALWGAIQEWTDATAFRALSNLQQKHGSTALAWAIKDYLEDLNDDE